MKPRRPLRRISPRGLTRVDCPDQISLLFCSDHEPAHPDAPRPWAIRRHGQHWQVLRHIPHARIQDPEVTIRGARYQPMLLCEDLGSALDLVDQMLRAARLPESAEIAA